MNSICTMLVTKCIIIIKLIDFLVGNTKNVSCNVKCINALYIIFNSATNVTVQCTFRALAKLPIEQIITNQSFVVESKAFINTLLETTKKYMCKK